MHAIHSPISPISLFVQSAIFPTPSHLSYHFLLVLRWGIILFCISLSPIVNRNFFLLSLDLRQDIQISPELLSQIQYDMPKKLSEDTAAVWIQIYQGDFFDESLLATLERQTSRYYGRHRKVFFSSHNQVPLHLSSVSISCCLFNGLLHSITHTPHEMQVPLENTSKIFDFLGGCHVMAQELNLKISQSS